MPSSKNEALSELFGRPLPKLPTLHDLMNDSAKRYGSGIAIACLHQKSDFLSPLSEADATKSKYLRWTFDELLRASHRTAIALAQSGIESGDLIAAYVTGGIEFHILFRAALELNCPFAPMNPKTSGNKKETLHYLNLLKPAVIVVPDQATAENLSRVASEQLNQAKFILKSSGSPSNDGWKDFCTFVIDKFGNGEAIVPFKVKRKADDIVLVLFTSGTTSMPKGVPHTNTTFPPIIYSMYDHLETDPSRASCHHLALFHIYGIHIWGAFHLGGGKVVHPAAWYDPGMDLAAIREERTTDIGGVPAMMTALVNHPDFAKTDTSCLQRVNLGATTILPQIIRLCKETLKANIVTDGFGMTETGVPWSLIPGQDLPRDKYPQVGSGIRICDPDTGKVLPRGTPGELHQGGQSVISRYWLAKDVDPEKANSCFYTDEFGHWMKTGDRAVMAKNGYPQVIGRYKDIIIRGGENIAPRAIESILADDFGLTAEVVGIPDEIAGEVPVAVVESESGEENGFGEIRGKISRDLGEAYVLEEMITLKDLGMETFPKTATGKVQKNELRDLVAKHLDQQEEGAPTNQGQLEALTNLWAKVLGVNAAKLAPETSVHQYADSLVLSRFSAKLRRSTGHSLTLQQLTDNPTIAQQAKLLESSSSTQKEDYSTLLSKHDGPPEILDIVHVMGSPQIFESTKRLSQELLQSMGLTWDDVEDVVPMHDAMQRLLKRRRPQSNNHRHAWLCRNATISQVQAALKESLTHHPIMRSMAILPKNSSPLHVIIRPTNKFMSHCIKVVNPVHNRDELDNLEYNNLDVDYAAYPGPMLRILVADVKEESCPGFIYMAQHSAFDGVSLPLWTDDIDAALCEPNTKLAPRVPYKAWADSYYNMRESSSAKLSISWNKERLFGISKHKASLYPPSRCSEMFKGNSEGWIDLSTGKPGSPRQNLDDFDGVRGTAMRAQLQDIQILKLNHVIEVPQIIKAALAIVNCHHTKTNVALFAQYQAARTWPFLSEWQVARMPDAMEVNGPTLEAVATIVPVENDLTVLGTLQRLQAEQAGLNEHSHAPYYSLLKELNASESKDGDMMEEILRRQIFNWLPGGAPEYKSLERLSMLSRTDVGLLWNCTMPEQGHVQVHASWDSAQLRHAEVKNMLSELVAVAEKLAKEESWEKKLADIL